jgi:transposase
LTNESNQGHIRVMTIFAVLLPMRQPVLGGEVHETLGFDALIELHDAQPAKLLGDKGYDRDEIRNDLAKRGIEPVIRPRPNQTTPSEYDREAYKRQNLIARGANRLKQFRRIATRYEKTARAFVSMLCIAAARLWIKTVNTSFTADLGLYLAATGRGL